MPHSKSIISDSHSGIAGVAVLFLHCHQIMELHVICLQEDIHLFKCQMACAFVVIAHRAFGQLKLLCKLTVRNILQGLPVTDFTPDRFIKWDALCSFQFYHPFIL